MQSDFWKPRKNSNLNPLIRHATFLVSHAGDDPVRRVPLRRHPALRVDLPAGGG